MTLAVGIDIVEIERISKLLKSQNIRFVKRVLNEKEQTLFHAVSAVNKDAWLAKRFAAKEAVFKALGCGLAQGVTFHDINVSNDAMGKPEVSLHKEALNKLALMGGEKVLVSLSDERRYAIAIANII